MADIVEIALASLDREQRWSAEYWRPQYQAPLQSRLDWRPIGEFLLSAQYGLSHDMNEEGDGPPCFRMNEMDGLFMSNAQKFMHVSQREKAEYSLNVGDVLFNRTNSLAFVGRTGFVSEPVDAVFASYLVRLVPNKARLLPEYLAAYLNSEVGIGQVKRRAMESINQANVSASELKKVPIPRAEGHFQERVAELIWRAARCRTEAKNKMELAERTLSESIGVRSRAARQTFCREVSFVELCASRRLDAEYFYPKYQDVLAVLGRDGRTLGDIADLMERKFRPIPEASSFDYIEIGDLRMDGTTGSETIEVANAPSRAQWVVKEGDVITSTVRPIRRLSALILPGQGDYVCSSGFAVLKPKGGILSEVLLTYLRIPVICDLLDLSTTASMYPAISTSRLLAIPFCAPPPAAALEVQRSVREGIALRAEAANLTGQATAMIDALVRDAQAH